MRSNHEYIGALLSARKELERLTAAVEESNSGFVGETRSWGEVNDMKRVAQQIKEAADFMTGEGEYAS